MSNWIRVLVAVLSVSFVIASATTAFAKQKGVGTVAMAPEQEQMMSATFAPLRLLSPMGKLTLEFNAEEQWTLAAIAGFGSFEEGKDAEGNLVSHDVWELGGQFRYYALGNFDHGLHLGIEALYRDAPVKATGVFSEIKEGTGRGLGVGPLVGYKLATAIGLTFDAQVGVRYDGFGLLSEAETAEELDVPDDNVLHPLINLNVGWTF